MLLLLFAPLCLVGICLFRLTLGAVVASLTFEFLVVGERLAGTLFNFFGDFLHFELHQGELLTQAQHLSFVGDLRNEHAVLTHNGHAVFGVSN